MWFLIVKIFLLMLLAALFGAWLAWWWFRRRYEDVTESHSQLMDQSTLALKGGLSREELREEIQPISARMGNMETSFANLAFPETDFSPLHDRFGRIETRLMSPDENVDALNARMAKLEGLMVQMGDQVGGLQNADLQGLEGQVYSLREEVLTLAVPEVDLGPVHSAIARLELALGDRNPEPVAAQTVDLDPIRGQLKDMEARLAAFSESLDDSRKEDFDNLNLRLTTLSSSIQNLRMPDVDGVQRRLDGLESSLTNLSFTAPEPDLRPIRDQISALEGQMRQPNDGSTLVQSRIADLEGAIAALHSKMGGVEMAVNSLDRIGVDMAPVDNRLMNIEVALSGMRSDLQSIGTPNMVPLERRIADLQDTLLALRGDMPTAVNLGPIERRLADLQDAFMGMRPTDTSTLERRMADVQDAMASMRQPDLTPVVNSLRTVETRMDMTPVESRLTAIEYSLAALKDMMRTNQSAEPLPKPEKAEPRAIPEPVIREPRPIAAPTTRSFTRPPRNRDPINSYRMDGDKANLLRSAAFGVGDELEEIIGVGPMLRQLLNDIGVYYFWQIAEWDEDDVIWVDEKLLHFRGRIERDDWVGQSQELAAMPTTADRPTD